MDLVPLGDQAVLAYLPDEPAAVRFAAAVRSAAPAWLEDVVPAYASVGVFFDADRAGLPEVTAWLERAGSVSDGSASPVAHASGSSRTHVIPVCYEMALDLPGCASTPASRPTT